MNNFVGDSHEDRDIIPFESIVYRELRALNQSEDVLIGLKYFIETIDACLWNRYRNLSYESTRVNTLKNLFEELSIKWTDSKRAHDERIRSYETDPYVIQFGEFMSKVEKEYKREFSEEIRQSILNEVAKYRTMDGLHSDFIKELDDTERTIDEFIEMMNEHYDINRYQLNTIADGQHDGPITMDEYIRRWIH